MSSINSNGSSSSLPYLQQSNAAASTQGSQGTAAARTVTGAGHLSPVSDEMAQAIGSGLLDVTKQKPPVPAETRPEAYTQNARGAAEALAPFAGGVSTPYQAALVASESGSVVAQSSRAAGKGQANGADDKEAQQADKATETRQKQVSSQAKSILDSTSESEKGSCKTHYTNHDDNVKAMQECGLSQSQAKKLTQLLEDGRTPQDVKDKVAYQLAAIGMTSNGASKPIAANAEQVRKGLQDLKVDTGGLGVSVAGHEFSFGGSAPSVDHGQLNSMQSADLSQARVASSPRTAGGALGQYDSQQLLNPEFATPSASSSSPSTSTSTSTSASSSLGTSASSGMTPQTEAQASIMGSALSGAYGEMKVV